MIARACVALLAALALAAVAAATASAVPAKFWGIVPQGKTPEAQLERVADGGVSTIRLGINWGSIVPTAGGAPNWTTIDEAVASSASAGLEVLPFVYSTPTWLAGATTLPVDTAQQRTAWSSFLAALVHRYGPGGEFWAAHPGVPTRPIRTWQIWNEENFFYFAAKPSPSKYGKLVKLSHSAIVGVDPGAKIVLGGMFALPKQGPPQAYPAYRFLQLMYKQTPGVKAAFDAVALHPYVREYQYLTPEVEQVRQTLRAAGDAAVPLWITEMGWSSEAPNHQDVFAKGRQGQVKQLKGAFKLVSKYAAKWRLKKVFWFSLEDSTSGAACNFCGGSGLFTSSFAPKPSWRAFVSFTGGTP